MHHTAQRRCASGLALAIALLIAWPAAAEGPSKLVTVDPLTLPPPRGMEELVLPVDNRSPGEKISRSVWSYTRTLPLTAVVPVIILLHDETGTPRPQDEAQQETQRLEGIARVEHTFLAAAQPLGARNAKGLSHFPIVFVDVPISSIDRLASLSSVKNIEYDLPLVEARVEGGNLIRAHEFRNTFGGTGAGVGVAVIDSGVDNSEPELASRVVAEGDFTGTTGDGTIDGTGHGTAVAGIIAGSAGGMARQANVWALKVFNSLGQTQESWVIAALASAYANRNSFGGLKVVNMSLGAPGPYNSDCDALFPAWALPVNQLVGAGIAVVVSSGNNAHSNGISTPACLSSSIAVGAVYDANIGPISFPPPGACADATTAADKITCYSDSGLPLDVLASSHCADTLGPEGSCFGGTSAAAPYTSGVIAQILSVLGGVTPAAMRTALMTSGTPIQDPRNGITRARIDAVEAYHTLSGGGSGPCVSGPTTLCIDDHSGDKRFKVEVHYQSALNGGISGDGSALPLSSLGVTKGGLFTFFGGDNPELMVKVVNGCGLNNHFWLYASGVTNLGLTVTVTDTIGSGQPFIINNPDLQVMASVATIEAFPCP